MSTRYVGIDDGNHPCSWIRSNDGIERDWIERVEKDHHRIFGAGPSEIIPVISFAAMPDRRELLIRAMTRIEEAPAGQGFLLLRYEDYVLWRDGDIPNTPRDPRVKPRKMFESDFEKLSSDGMLLTREPVSSEDAWNATLLACGARSNDSKGN